jgi:hypothetical protein
MPENDDLLTCLECGWEVDADLMDLHMERMHSDRHSRKISKAEQRLQAKTERGGLGLKIAAGVVILIFVLFAFNFMFLQPLDNDSREITNFQETEKQPDIVTIPNDNNPPDDDNSGSENDDTNTNNEVDDNTNNNNDTVDEPEPEPEPEILVVQIPTDDISTDAKWYPYDSDSVEIRFFAVRSNDNEIHVAFDACDVCYDAKLGYRQDGVKMVCNNCDKSFPIRAIGTENKAGGCWPSYLPMSIDDDNIIIKILDLEEKKYMFE